jgi:hypothetical protein
MNWVLQNLDIQNGWLTRFKSRHSISCLSITGESAGIDKKLITDRRKDALEVMKNLDIKDIFNVDETGLFYRMDPNKSLTTSSDTKGKKEEKRSNHSCIML